MLVQSYQQSQDLISVPALQNNHMTQCLVNYQDTPTDLVIGLKGVIKEDTQSLEQEQIIDAGD